MNFGDSDLPNGGTLARFDDPDLPGSLTPDDLPGSVANCMAVNGLRSHQLGNHRLKFHEDRDRDNLMFPEGPEGEPSERPLVATSQEKK